MKVKEIERTANVAWSPAAQHPIYLAAGTAAQQLDATFSTSAALEIYMLNLAEGGLEMPVVGSLQSEFRFHKLVWGAHDIGSTETPSGVLVGGTEKGQIFVWNSEKLIRKEDPLILKLEKHTGAVGALDINPFQQNLLASGASDSEIFIWDLNNPSNPMTPGTKSQPPDDVTCIAWNKQVQHILASTYAGRCVVWDLRKNEPIIKVSDSMSRIKSKLLAWHPEVATQLCLASEDDHTPVIQLWDLRFATSPLKSLESHTRGVLSVAWCPQDPDLLLSCGKDNRILCWNPNSNVQTGEVVYELPTTSQWSFDVQWCPRNPAVISSAAFDGHVNIYSLMGGSTPVQPSSKIAESFPGDPFAQPMQQQETPKPAAVVLKKPPKWLRRPVGASFGFGGRLVTFESPKPAAGHPQQAQQPAVRQVSISQVVTETELVMRSSQLESAITNEQFSEFCALKIANSKGAVEENIWSFLKVNFEKEPRTRFLQLLGYDQNNLTRKVTEAKGTIPTPVKEENGVDANELAQKMAALSSSSGLAPALMGSSGQSSPYMTQTPGESESTSAFDQIASQVPDSRSDSPFPITVDDDVDGLITQAVLTANFEAAVDMCLHDNRMAEAIILAIAGGPELLARTQKNYFRRNKSGISRLISSVVTRDFEHIVRTCCLDNWREALAVALTYAKSDEFASLCDIMGSRLESERHGEFAIHACLCYICAGNVERLVECWSKNMKTDNEPGALQDLVEKVVILRKAVEMAQGAVEDIKSGILAEKLSCYSELLAAQGSLSTALNYLGTSNETSLSILRDRLYQALGQAVPGVQPPPFPFQKIDVAADGVRQPIAQPASQANMQQQQRPNARSAYHQSQASSNFFTATTTSSTYYSEPQYGGVNGPAPTTPTYSQGQSSFNTPAPGIASKGPLAQKYPSYPQSTSSYDPYGLNTNYSGYGQQDNYSAPYSSSFGSGSVGPVQPSSQPNIYNPVAAQPTPGAPTPMQSMRPSYQEVRSTTAWNDPPVVSEKKKPAPKPYEPPAPITAPLYGAPETQEQTPPGAPNYSGMPQIYNPQEYQSMPQQQGYLQPMQQAPVTQFTQPPTSIGQVKQPEPQPKPVKKGPIPAEHQVLQEIFEALVNQCLGRATNPQTKRKLEDVLRKLEVLYDKLRESKLSSNVILGLHQIIQAIQQCDYQTGLYYHTQLISQGNFSEISSFMPGLKMLMQTAMQLQVYVAPVQ